MPRQSAAQERQARAARRRQLRELRHRAEDNSAVLSNQNLSLQNQQQVQNMPVNQSQQQPQQVQNIPFQVQLQHLTQLWLQRRLRQTSYELKDFRALCTLGTGTFGRVKLVIHIPSSTTFALKIQSKYQIIKHNLRQHIFNEKAILMSVNHPFIVTLHQTFQDQDYLYMLLELVQGGELFTLLQNYGPKMQTGHHVFYTCCVLSALEALHSLNILYRDLKPENCMIDHLGYLKLVDFGFAKRVERATFTLCGTPDYLSPELVMGCGYGKGNDIWALGILAYELIAGFTPFGTDENSTAQQQQQQANTANTNNVVINNPQLSNNMVGNNSAEGGRGNEIYRRIVQEPVMFPRDCYDRVGMDLISQLLEKDPNKRFGCGRLGISEIKLHKWFERVDWNALLSQRIQAPWKPSIRNQIDSTHFDRYEEKYPLIRFMCDPNNDPFKGF